MKHIVLNSLSIAMVCTLCATGCVPLLIGAAGAGAAGTYAYVKGQMEVTYAADYERTWAATLDTLKALGVTVQDANKDAFGGEIRAKRADDTSVTIQLAPVTSNATSAKIRVGTFGNRTISERISKEIENRL
jgi:hypothetical protein